MKLVVNLLGAMGATLASLAFGGGQAHAGLLGSEATFQYYAYGGPFTYPGSQNTFIVDGSTQVHFGMDQKFIGTYFEATVTDNKIEYDYVQDISPFWAASPVSYANGPIVITNGALMSFVGAPPILGASLGVGSTAIPGLSAANVMFTSSEVGISWAGLSFHAGDKIVLDITTGPALPPVPEPATWGMFLAGLGILGFARIRGDR